MAEYGHDELVALFKERGGMQSLGALKGEAVMGRMAIPPAQNPVATAPARPQGWLGMDVK